MLVSDKVELCAFGCSRRRLELRLSLGERERDQVVLTIEDLENQVRWRSVGLPA